ncbi:uncharacterized protein LOC142526845 [Primulina tabacum]|uniref:uncharacterized protein LOC142526845 n=1 Tax=Primulina tabacum TaxID=48773 RepID=UPI003F5A7FB0
MRCGKSCRLRWMNYLRPGIKRRNISQDEEDLIVRLHSLLGNRWSLIAGRLPGRTDNEIKNYWNTYLLKKLNKAGLRLTPNKNFRKPRKSSAAGDHCTATPNKERKKNKIVVNTHPDGKEKTDDIPKTKVYLPKPIRVSSAFSRTNSFESGSSSNGGGDAGENGAGSDTELSNVPGVGPIFELEDADDGVSGGDDDFPSELGMLPPTRPASSDDVVMLYQVYEEYLQLI